MKTELHDVAMLVDYHSLPTKDNNTLIAKVERYKATFTLALQSTDLKLGSIHTYFP